MQVPWMLEIVQQMVLELVALTGGSELTNDSRDGNSEAETWFKTNY